MKLAHRWSHEYNFAWAAHSVHHNSENFNLSTALRQSAFQRYTINNVFIYCFFFFFFPKGEYKNKTKQKTSTYKCACENCELNSIVCNILERATKCMLQFWIHTQYVRELGPLEYIINTPRQHKNHHSRAPAVCNTNYAGVLSIWDQLFGTFDLQSVPNMFGTIDIYIYINIFFNFVLNLDKPDTFDPITLQFRNFGKLFSRMWQKKGIWAKLQVLGRYGRFEIDTCMDDHVHEPAISFVFLLLDYLCLSKSFRLMPILPTRLMYSLYLLGSLSSLGQYLNKQHWSRFSEMLRYALSLFVLCFANTKHKSMWQGTAAHWIVHKCQQSKHSILWKMAKFVFIAWSVTALLHLYTQKKDGEHVHLTIQNCKNGQKKEPENIVKHQKK
ncbi:hypothetical protein RFI_15645 [Reticulomyxa filosa]|uniref:Fatty acid hydroxylase domain-containing protein n=1 Tax=Reticulomyxa filosa TaxID=46433 RepID=X6N6J0_RETFI|nr:hypothetical protein RFI_15645 [Reticulomyxa filosa]|eukprot:ETO21563.1 hypothetical protein RFI_15645 [Reticulomyxa filosa]